MSVCSLYHRHSLLHPFPAACPHFCPPPPTGFHHLFKNPMVIFEDRSHIMQGFRKSAHAYMNTYTYSSSIHVPDHIHSSEILPLKQESKWQERSFPSSSPEIPLLSTSVWIQASHILMLQQQPFDSRIAFCGTFHSSWEYEKLLRKEEVSIP